jgi:four helix bundle protein
LPATRAGNYVAGQLIRCGLSPTLNYGEAQSAESVDDFIHKLKIVVKELKETRTCLKLIRKKERIKPIEKRSSLFQETKS